MAVTTKTGVRNALAQLRAKRGIGPSQLAAQVGISRQTVYAIEAGTYVPNTSVSLKLARILDTSVEEIFQLEQEDIPLAEEADVVVLGEAASLTARTPLRLCRVDQHIVAVPPEPGGWGLPPTDAVLLTLRREEREAILGARARVKILGESWNNPERLLIAGCDPSAAILANCLQHQECQLIIAYENSFRSLSLLREGIVHIAGTHLTNTLDSKAALRSITKNFPRNSMAIFSYAVWREGIVLTPGNPKKITGVADFTRKDVEIANREPGAGCRQLLDDLLNQAGITPDRVKGHERVVLGQLPAARLVQSGEVDCCISTEASARSLGLEFVPLAEKPYHLVVHRKHLELHPVQTLIETLGRLSFRREVEACVGYDMHQSGERVL